MQNKKRREPKPTKKERSERLVRPAQRDLAAAALLAILTFVAYWPAIHGGIIMDDARYMTRSSLGSLAGLYRIWFEVGATPQYYPLLHSAFWTEYHLWGHALTGYHIVNVTLHIGSALLLVAILRQLSVPGAWLAGFVFALHPLMVESVAWISEQKNTLSTIFYLGAALAYLRFDRSREKRSYLVALGLFCLALLSKSVTTTLPAALLVVFWWERGKLEWKRDFVPIAPMFAVGAAMGLITAWVEWTYVGAAGPDFALSAGARIVLAGRAIWFYLQKVVWPFHYLFIYPRWNVEAAPLWQYAFPLGVLALTAGLVIVARWNRAPLALFAIFTITLIPILGFLNIYAFLYSYVWDHFLYLASPAIIVAFTASLTLLMQQWPLRNWSRNAVQGVLVAGLFSLTFLHAGTFRDGTTLYSDTIRQNPDAWMAHNNLGTELMVVPGKLPEAIDQFQMALRIRPQVAFAHHNLGSALAAMPGRTPDAIREYEIALQLNENFPEAHNNLGRELTKIPGRQAEGISHLEKAIAYNPDFADAHLNLGVALSHIPGRNADAITQMETALRLDPALPGGRDNLELALSDAPGRASESIGYFEEQVREHPDSAEAQNGLGAALRNDPNRAFEAIAHFREALRIKPDFIPAHMSLADMLLTKFPNRQAEAIAEYQSVLRLDAHFPEAHNNLGNAFLATGRQTEAAREFEAAIADDPSSADPHMNLGVILFDTPGRLQDAITHFQQAARLDPNLAEAHSYLGYAFVRLHRTPEAVAEFEASLRLKPDPEVQQKVAQLRNARVDREP